MFVALIVVAVSYGPPTVVIDSERDELTPFVFQKKEKFGKRDERSRSREEIAQRIFRSKFGSRFGQGSFDRLLGEGSMKLACISGNTEFWKITTQASLLEEVLGSRFRLADGAAIGGLKSPASMFLSAALADAATVPIAQSA